MNSLINENSNKKKVVIVISSGDKQVIMPALNMALKSKRDNLYEDVKVQFFGISQKIAAEDPEVQELISELVKAGISPMACRHISDKFEVTVKLDNLGFDNVQIPIEIAKLVNEGYIPMVF
ncbi:MAG TPA: hypothetical protein PLN50_04635 [Coprothermobacter proteolyticus]|nr:hypothetical protein [Coprothermobacter proteolyticus]